MQKSSMTYAGVGVDYDPLDRFKRQAQQEAKQTAKNLEQFGYKEVEWSRGESVYLYETPDSYRAHVNEGLGTKNLVADAMYQLTGWDHWYEYVAIDTVAMIVNDMITLGAKPLTITMHIAAGNSSWFKDEQRTSALLRGWRIACDKSGCTWAGGETPVLKDMVESNTFVISGSADGEIRPKQQLIKPTIQAGDAIVLFASSGIHANGLTMAREIAEKLPRGYMTRLHPNRLELVEYGDALLRPTIIYVPVIEHCLRAKIEIHYAVHITGHGWRKLMRATEPFVYVVENIGQPHPLFAFMQQHGPISDEEAYANFNMGAGFALYVPPSEVAGVIALAKAHGIHAWHGGHIEKHGDDKKVIIVPKGITLEADSMAIR